jgi:hypothetical protein
MSEPLPPIPRTPAEIMAHTVDLTEGIDATKPTGTAPYVAGFYSDENAALSAVQAVRAAGHTAVQVWSPFPIHGLDPELGLQRSLIGRPVFALSIVGFLFTFFGIYHLMVQDWAVVYGGKPFFTWQLWLVPTLEAGLLFGAILNLKLVMHTCKLIPDPFVRLPDPRVTDDQFCVAVSTASTSAADLTTLMTSHGAVETRLITAEVANGLPVFQGLPGEVVAAQEHAHA